MREALALVPPTAQAATPHSAARRSVWMRRGDDAWLSLGTRLGGGSARLTGPTRPRGRAGLKRREWQQTPPAPGNRILYGVASRCGVLCRARRLADELQTSVAVATPSSSDGTMRLWTTTNPGTATPVVARWRRARARRV